MRGDIRRVLAMATGCLLAALAHSGSPTQRAHPDPVVFHQEIVRKPDVYIETYVTGYNTVATQTVPRALVRPARTFAAETMSSHALPS
jgi:hypothetical protein